MPRAVCAAVLFAASFGDVASAQARCTPVREPDVAAPPGQPASGYPDADAELECRDETGLSVPARRDSLGRVFIRDRDGDPVYGRTDSLGITTFRPEPPEPPSRPSYSAAPDGLGGVILRDETGGMYHPHTDPIGNSVFRDGQGRVVRCYTDPNGVTFCD